MFYTTHNSCFNYRLSNIAIQFVIIFGFLKNRFHGKFFALRSGLTTSFSQFIDTVVFTFAALYGITYSVAQVITLSFAIKLLAIALATPFIAFAKRILKKNRQP